MKSVITRCRLSVCTPQRSHSGAVNARGRLRCLTLTAFILLTCLGARPAGAVPNLLINGSFEDPVVGGAFITRSGGEMDGWTITSGTVDQIGTYWPAAVGAQSIDLAGDGPGRIEQTFATVVGRQYRLGGYYANNPDNPAGASTADVFLDGAHLTTLFHNSSVQDHMDWQVFSFDFVAAGPTTTIAFQDTTGGGYGIALDGLSVTDRPEPPGANLLVNPSFEDPVVRAPYERRIGNDITGWVITSGNVDQIGTYWTAADGGQSLDLAGDQPGTIEQTFATVPGGRYRVSGFYANNPDNPTGASTANILVDGTAVATLFHNTSTYANMDWKPFSFTFTATGSSSTLAFQDTTGGGYGIALDNLAVRRVGVP